jgi:hypothetical protein
MKRGELIQALEAAQTVMQNAIACWEKGDLAAAMREMQTALDDIVNPAIAWWESENE